MIAVMPPLAMNMIQRAASDGSKVPITAWTQPSKWSVNKPSPVPMIARSGLERFLSRVIEAASPKPAAATIAYIRGTGTSFVMKDDQSRSVGGRVDVSNRRNSPTESRYR